MAFLKKSTWGYESPYCSSFFTLYYTNVNSALVSRGDLLYDLARDVQQYRSIVAV